MEHNECFDELLENSQKRQRLTEHAEDEVMRDVEEDFSRSSTKLRRSKRKRKEVYFS